MPNLHELLGREIEKRMAAEEKVDANFAAYRGLCEIVAKIKSGEIDIDRVDVNIGPEYCTIALQPKPTADAAALANAVQRNGVPIAEAVEK